MDKYIIQSSDNKEFELTVDQINKYPFFKDQLKDLYIEPGTIFAIPFPADLLIIAFNNDYNQQMGLDKLVKVIQLVAYLGLANEANQLLKTLLLYLQQKFTAPQVGMIQSIVNTLDSIMLQLFLSKTISPIPNIDYHNSLFLTNDVNAMKTPSASVTRPSANLDYTLISSSYPQVINSSYSLWHKNKVVIPEMALTYTNYLNSDITYISNDGKYYDLVKHEAGGTATYDITPLSPNEPAIGTISVPSHRVGMRISLDLSKYSVQYGRGELYIGSVAEPQNIITIELVSGYHLSPLFNTIISPGYPDKYTIHHIENNQLFSKSVTYYKYGIKRMRYYFFSYDGKMIAEVADNYVRVLNSKGDILAQKDMSHNEQIIAITNKYLITYHIIANELHFWSIEGLSNAINPSFIINALIGKERSPNIDYTVTNVKVIMGQNNSFLLTRDVIIKRSTKTGRFMTNVTNEKFFEWTKYSFGPYNTMDQFYASLVN